MRFEKGNKYAKGGVRPGSGRKPDWFKDKMAEIASRKESIAFVEKCIDGEYVDRVVDEGRVILVPPPAQVRLHAWCEARDTGYGKPRQEMEISGLSGVNISVVLSKTEEARLLRGLSD